MNKALSIVLCYAIGMAAFDIHAAKNSMPTDPIMSIDFSEEGLWGKTPHWGLSEDGQYEGQSATHWWTADSNSNYSVMRDYTTKERKKCYAAFDVASLDPPVNPQPSYMQSGEDNIGFLSFSTAVALYRTIKQVNEDGTTEKENITSYKTGYDIFFDQLVQFTRRDETSLDSIAEFLPDEAKFACWLPADTNGLVVTAGRYARGTNSVLYVTNYVTASNIETGKWYRLTVRTIGDASLDGNINDKVQGMAVYLDGKLLACGDEYQIGDDEDAMNDRFRGSPYYAAHALYPSLLPLKKSNASICGLALLGKGWIDEIGVTQVSNPLWPSDRSVDEIELQVSVEPAKVTNVCVSVTAKDATDPYTTVETQGDSVTFVTVKPNDSVKISVKTIDDVAAKDKVTYAGNVLAIPTTARNRKLYAFTLATEFLLPDSLIVRVDTFTANFEVDGKSFETVKEALAAAWSGGTGSGKFSLMRDLTLAKSAAKDNGQMHVLPDYSLLFDLCGHWLRGDNFRNEAAIYDQGRLTIVDSVGGGGIVAPGKVIEVASTNIALEINYTNAVLTLGDKDITGDFTVTGRVVCTKGDLILKGGTYVTPTNLMPTTQFYLNQYVAPERFYAVNDLSRDPTPGQLWKVCYDGRHQVRFEVPHGAADPSYTNVNTTAGAYLAAPAITNAAGYTVTNWYVKGVEPQLDWHLATDAVTNDMTLVAQQRLDGFSISYSKPTASSGWPTAYTVETTTQDLPTPTKIANYTFVTWHDQNTDRDVTTIGAGAKWPGTDEPVASDLDLVGVWKPDVLQWTNIGSFSSESNGYYTGTWRFTVPVSSTLTADKEVIVDEIDFSLVNPLTLPKSADFLAVTPNGGSPVVSATRPVNYDSTSGEYGASTNVTAAGRVRLAYRFTGLVVKPGVDNVAQFSTTAGAVTPVTDEQCFLRLAVKPAANDAVFGNCTAPEEYTILCPVYEVFGHVKGEVE